MSENTNFMNFENLNKLIEEHRKETIPYKNYEFDNTSYTLLLININNLLKENKQLKDIIKKIKEICNKVPNDWSICGIEIIHEIEEVLKELDIDKGE